MAQFYQLKPGKVTLDKCLAAMQKAFGTELWMDSFKENSIKKGCLDSGMNGLLHWWQSIRDTDVTWEYWLTSKDRAYFNYEDSAGRVLYIYDLREGTSIVSDKCIGIPPQILEELNGLNRDQLYMALETKVIGKFIGCDEMDMKITDIAR